MPTLPPYDAFYYAHCCGRPYERSAEWLAFFRGIADRVVRDIAPRRVLDAGCAMGLLVEALRERGVEAWGIDVSEYAIERVHDSVRPFCRVGSVSEPLDGRFDLIVCMEVLEHLPADAADAAIAEFCSASDDVLFSSTPNDYREPTHVNVQPPEVWAERFARTGFIRDVEYDASYITPWGMRFRRSREPVHRVVRAYERQIRPLETAAREARAYAAELQGELARARAQASQFEHELASAHQRIRRVEGSLLWRAAHPLASWRNLRQRRRKAPG